MDGDGGSGCHGESVMGNGFTFSPEWCTLLFFQGWVLNTNTKLWIGYVGLFLFAVGFEGFTLFRRKFKKNLEAKYSKLQKMGATKTGFFGKSNGLLSNGGEQSLYRTVFFMKIANSALHAISIGLGYLLMLVPMTYDAGLTIAVLLGYGCGHYFFHNYTESEVHEACCGEAIN